MPSIREHVHDFGTVLAVPGHLLKHTFRVPNEASTAYVIDRVVNPKPCCIQLAVDSPSVEPGATICAHLGMKVGSAPMGKVEWFAAITPKDPSQPPLRFVGTAVILPRARMVWKREPTGATLFPGERREFAGTLVPCGRPDEDLSLPETTQWAEWDQSFLEVEIPVTLTVDADHELGYHQATFELAWTALQHRMVLPAQWETVAPIVAKPRALVFHAAESSEGKTVRLEAIGGQHFSITGIDEPPGFHAFSEVRSASQANAIQTHALVQSARPVPDEDARRPVPNTQGTVAEITVMRCSDTTPERRLSRLEVHTTLGTVAIPLFDAVAASASDFLAERVSR